MHKAKPLLLALLLVGASCGGSESESATTTTGAASSTTSEVSTTDPPSPAGSSTSQPAGPTSSGTTPEVGTPPTALNHNGAPPWAAAPISSGPARDVGVQEWLKSKPGPQDQLILPADVRLSPQSKVRRANFGDDQWAVAWDDPGKPGVFASGGYCTDCGRGTVGLASQKGGLDPAAGTRVAVVWSDGTRVGYGPIDAIRDDGSAVIGGQWRATISIPNHSSGYYLWTYGGREHLENLLGQLRFVEGAP